jgi:hypothetical protein
MYFNNCFSTFFIIQLLRNVQANIFMVIPGVGAPSLDTRQLHHWKFSDFSTPRTAFRAFSETDFWIQMSFWFVRSNWIQVIANIWLTVDLPPFAYVTVGVKKGYAITMVDN